MFAGIDYYGTTYGNRPYRREMGETPEDMAKAVKYQEAQEARSRNYEYRGREFGEDPYKIPSREQQDEYYRRAERENPPYPSTPKFETRPREMGETPEEVARANQKRREEYEKMTEQQRRLDLFA